jgi:hypothetical protein
MQLLLGRTRTIMSRTVPRVDVDDAPEIAVWKCHLTRPVLIRLVAQITEALAGTMAHRELA